jgi:nucleoside-diphosphate-sugar epimerase
MATPSSLGPESPPRGRYLLLGATGLVGSHALHALAGRSGVEVRAVGHGRLPERLAANVSTHRLDLREPGVVDSLLEGVDFVLLFAGRVLSAPVLAADPVGPVLDHLRLVAAALEASFRARVRKTVWLSSTTGYPALDEELHEDHMFVGDPPDVWHLVGWTARYLEALAQGLARRSTERSGAGEEPRGTFVALRPSLIYGANDDFSPESAHFLPALIRRVVERRRPIEVWGDGGDRRDLVHADDVVAAAFAALPKVQGCAAFNVCAGRSHSVSEVLDRIVAIDGFDDARIEYTSGRPQTARERRLSPGKAAAALGFTTRVDLDAGLRRTIAWFRENRDRARGADVRERSCPVP